MNDHTVAMMKELSKGRCSCYNINGSGNIPTYDCATGQMIEGHYDPGTKITCMRCQAREALEADGIEYEKVDHVPMYWQN